MQTGRSQPLHSLCAAQGCKPDEQALTLLALIDAEYTRHPFYGSRKIKIYLRGLGHKINRKRVQRLMGVLGLAGMAPGPNTSRPHPRSTRFIRTCLEV